MNDLRQYQSYGRGGDTMLAHINPQEANLLRGVGGAGTTNPYTGLLEFSHGPGGYGGDGGGTPEGAQSGGRGRGIGTARGLPGGLASRATGPNPPGTLGRTFSPSELTDPGEQISPMSMDDLKDMELFDAQQRMILTAPPTIPGKDLTPDTELMDAFTGIVSFLAKPMALNALEFAARKGWLGRNMARQVGSISDAPGDYNFATRDVPTRALNDSGTGSGAGRGSGSNVPGGLGRDPGDPGGRDVDFFGAPYIPPASPFVPPPLPENPFEPPPPPVVPPPPLQGYWDGNQFVLPPLPGQLLG